MSIDRELELLRKIEELVMERERLRAEIEVWRGRPQKLVDLSAKAMPGPWVIEGRPPNMLLAFAGEISPRLTPFFVNLADGSQPANAEFIVECVNYVREQIARSL